MGRRADTVALGDHVTCKAFALAALGGNPQFKLDLVKAHASVGVAGDVAVRNSTADANDHGQTLVDERTMNGSAQFTGPLKGAWLGG